MPVLARLLGFALTVLEILKETTVRAALRDITGPQVCWLTRVKVWASILMWPFSWIIAWIWNLIICFSLACNCSGLSSTCNVNTGVCSGCTLFTTGNHCELCDTGYAPNLSGSGCVGEFVFVVIVCLFLPFLAYSWCIEFGCFNQFHPLLLLLF